MSPRAQLVIIIIIVCVCVCVCVLQGIMDAFDHVLPQIAPCFNLDAWHRCFSKITHMIAEKLPH